MFVIEQALTMSDLDEIRFLFREYESWLGLDLCFQDFEREIRELPGQYSSPGGLLMLAKFNNEPAGCAAFRQLSKTICEMKRLYVKPAYQGKGLGRSLAAAVIEGARTAGYTAMRLDTYAPKMPNALRLYRSFGFNTIDKYYENPYSDIVYMELKLR